MVVCHYSPAEDLPPAHRGWEEAFGHDGQDLVHRLLERLVARGDVDPENVGIVTFEMPPLERAVR